MQTTPLKPRIGITTGDINGIGIELIIKAFSEHRLLDFVTPIIFASNKVVNYYKNLIADSHMQYSGTKDLNNLNPKLTYFCSRIKPRLDLAFNH
jgi:4-hydroxythreonine-4-phosphate dehydrogenase